jgi:hypothetical protein
MSTTSEPPELSLSEFLDVVERPSLRAVAKYISELERENARLWEAVQRVHFELGEYIDANGGEVRVNVALAFEIARHAVEAALAGSGEP